MTGRIKRFLILGVMTLILGCGGKPVVPVSDLTEPATRDAVRTVKAGDTLYVIAWEYGKDYREVARWNGIQPPYRIYVGQKIKMYPPRPTTRKTNTSTVSVTPIPAPELKREPLPSPTATPAPQPKPKTSQGLKWRWPAKGKVVSGYSIKSGNKGIDIAGKSGDPVRAAASGKVVYAGAGLRGYGQLLIVKHNDEYLSAYAHNRALLVREGDEVRSGQVIAEMGNTGTNTTRLHFEIRRQGEPVDPQRYLPKT